MWIRVFRSSTLERAIGHESSIGSGHSDASKNHSIRQVAVGVVSNWYEPKTSPTTPKTGLTLGSYSPILPIPMLLSSIHHINHSFEIQLYARTCARDERFFATMDTSPSLTARSPPYCVITTMNGQSECNERDR